MAKITRRCDAGQIWLSVIKPVSVLVATVEAKTVLMVARSSNKHSVNCFAIIEMPSGPLIADSSRADEYWHDVTKQKSISRSKRKAQKKQEEQNHGDA